MSGSALLWHAWRLDPLALVLCALLVVGWRFAAGARGAYLLAAGLGVVLALASPIAALAQGVLFSAHMLEHLLLVLVVPPLVLLGLPRLARGAVTEMNRAPVLPWAMGVGAMWLWHAPALCNLASVSVLVHRLQELSLLGMGALFWRPVLGRRMHPLGAVVYLFTACVACTILGILVTFSPVEVCSAYLAPTDPLGALPLVRGAWGLTPAKDQELGGLLMWVPGCLVYAAAILGSVARLYRDDALDERELA
jgi:putative membrane protein